MLSDTWSRTRRRSSSTSFRVPSACVAVAFWRKCDTFPYMTLINCLTGFRPKRAIKTRRSLCAVVIREYQESDRGWVEAFMNDQFGGALQARRGQLIDVLALPGFVAERDGRPVGVVTYRRESNECELAFIAALERHEGVGTALLEALLEAVAECERIWLVTTNDNLDALRFYQRRGFVLSALRPGAGADSRQRLKPQIASVGDFGIPVRDELELRLLTDRPAGHRPWPSVMASI
jgi:ribosomal protein S18 acetylase RimI-like enzyme